ncbi:PIG-L family deacetylase [Streptomyces sp. N2-109]|uniref:PIG-L family deacetylase n=1 Tax=Streptomyces gossypii TaxID=2883101 RepID=A0ABT2JTR5_9ACTN|nr:sugar-binding protein [Streptomyces gossypii]MCT2590755.1 PIG-L family deacetylase [Streptomyces gossypii]
MTNSTQGDGREPGGGPAEGEAARRGMADSAPSRRTVSAALVAGLAGTALAAASPLAQAEGWSAPRPRRGARGRHDRAHNDVLFVGAHPDDEHGNFSTFGQWRERYGVSTGVLTVTRGEGGGNAVGLEEGAELGLIREDEERKATAPAGITNVYYLDKPDFWYTLSGPLTAAIWDERDTLERMVRLIRATTPYTVVTMDPRPFNQHGGHQLSARLAIEAFFLAGDPRAFPSQITREHYRPWQPRLLLAQNYRFGKLLGPDAPKRRRTDPDSGLPVFGVWSGTKSSEHGASWAQVERDAAREYRSQGFATLPPKVPTDPAELGSDWFTVLAADGRAVEAEVRPQSGLRPLYAEFKGWTARVGLPWLANNAQPDYPAGPSTTIPEVSGAPVLDGVERDGEYPGPELPLVHWQGTEAGADDVSATAKLARHGDDLYVLVKVTDDRKGAALGGEDIKRHWRTDSVEITLDPRGTADDTSTTFKAGIFPFTAHGGGPAAERDGDNRQGPAKETAPGMRVAATVTEPYRSYTVETKIPLAELPAAADPEAFAVNVLVYDSDTEDKTGQTRLAWSPFGSAQADPYVWGNARLTGYTPPPDRPTTPAEPDIPQEAARSEDSPASVAQYHRTGVPLAVGPRS